MPFILSLDEGTTSARAALYDQQGRLVGMEAVAFPCQYPHPGWVEQDALAIWDAQMEAARRVLGRTGIHPREIAAAGIANQRETTVVWDRVTGKPIAPAIVWQCRRTADFCARLRASADAAGITAKTGLVIDAYFSASKIRWILDNVADARGQASDGRLLFGTIDTWLIWKLSNGREHVTDATNASRTLLMNLATGEWDDDLLRIFDVPRAMLPRIAPSSAVAGVIAAEHFGVEIPIAGIAGDQQAALAGQACFEAGLSKNTYGTGCFALMHAGSRAPVSRHQLLATRAASPDATARFAIEGSVFIAGAAIQWVRDQMGLVSSAADSEKAGEFGGGQWRRVLRAGVCRLRRAALGFLRARAHHRADAFDQQGAYCARRARKHRLSDARVGEGHGGGCRGTAARAARGWRRRGQQFSAAVSGEYSGPADCAAGGYRNDCARSGVSGGPGGGFLEECGGSAAILAGGAAV